MHSPTLLLPAALLLAAGLGAQARNVTLLGRFQPNDAFNDVWGHVDPATGREFALVGSRQGTYVVETTDPTQPIQRGYFPAALSGWSPSTWRDIRTFGSYAYVVTEGGGGMQILDLSDPANPAFVRTFRPSGVSWGNTHNVSVDLETGMLYAVGTARGTHIFDLNANPTDPRHVTSYTAEYVHDLQVKAGRAYLSEINRNVLRVLDVTNLPALPTLAAAGMISSHQAWPSDDDTLVAGASEAIGGLVTIYDTTNPTRMTSLASFNAASAAYSTSVHNVFLKERLMHCAWYMEGYVLVDLSDPRRPTQGPRYDTLPGGAGVFAGAWGCYPFQPSGNVYVNDMSTGLYVLRPATVPESYGRGTPGNTRPTIHTFGAAYLGTPSFQLEVRGAQPGARVFFLVGAAGLNLPIAGHELLVDIAIGGVAEAVADGRGIARTALPLPNDPRLDGAAIHVQALCADAAAPLGHASTAGMIVRPFAR
jgi:choice-of-anchor B domain-containing protein